MRILIVGKPEAHPVRRLLEEGKRAGHEAVAAPVGDLRFEVRRDRRSVFLGEVDVFTRFDAVILWNFYPYFSEALLLAEWASERGLAVFDRTFAEDNYVKSKLYDAWVLAEAGLPVPDSVQVMDMRRSSPALDGMRWPAVAKGTHGSQGRWVFKVDSVDQARRELKAHQSGIFVFQEFLPITDEFRIVTVGGETLAAVRKEGPLGDFRRNLAIGAAVEKADLPMVLLKLAERASRALKRDIAGVDLALAGGKAYILEVNARPGFQGFEEATGANVAKAFIDHVAQDRDRRPAERRKEHALPGPDEETS